MAYRNRYLQRIGMPKKKEIYAYWKNVDLPPVVNGEYYELEERTCFACGSFYTLDRAHIIPLVEGGSNSVENIHLLCRSCHSRSENNKKYWNWLVYMRASEWKSRTGWCIKIMQMNGVDIEREAERMDNLGWNDRQRAIYDLLLDNGIGLIPKDPHDPYQEI